jgi:hypothetical protein
MIVLLARLRIAALAASLAATTACDGETRRAGSPRAEMVTAYPDIVAAAERERRALAEEWRAATGAAEERALDRAADALAGIVADRILPAWNGTPWSFSGTAQAPGSRPIACGYFVATALEDAGLRVERRRLAQQAAEDIVLSLVPAERVARFRRASLDTFLAAVARSGDGLYVVGLDYHVGFLLMRRGRAFFHHSSLQAGGVLREPAILSLALATSSYRVAGKLFDREVARSWLAQSTIATRTR